MDHCFLHICIFLLKTKKWFVDIVKIKTIKWTGQFVVRFKEQTQSILPEVIKLSTVDRPEMLFIDEHHQYFRIAPELLLQSPKVRVAFLLA